MNNLDPHTLFSIFEQGDEQIYREHGIEGTLNNPYVLISMCARGLENYNIMDQMYMRQYPQQYKNSRKLIQFKYFNKLYTYLQRVKVGQLHSVYKIGSSYEVDNVITSLTMLLFYFERIEHYEKCAIIKKITDKLQQHPVLI